MSKEPLSLRIPEHIVEDIDEIKDEKGMSDRSEAAREVIRRGLDGDETDTPAGEQLAQQATGIAAVGAVVATLSVLVGQAWTLPLVMPFWAATFGFSLLWASIRTLGGSDLL